MLARNVGQLIEGRPLYWTDGDADVATVCGELRDRNIGVLAVLDDGRLTGIISERDVVSRVVAAGRDPRDTKVAAVMTPDPVTVRGTDTILDALERMLAGGFRHLPVVDGEQAVSMVSLRDIPIDNRFLYQRYVEAQHALPIPAHV